jgi:hypothetical protein
MRNLILRKKFIRYGPFEESAAACISDMLLHVSNGACVEGVKMAGNFLTHVEVLFTAIDDLQAQYRDIEDAGNIHCLVLSNLRLVTHPVG